MSSVDELRTGKSRIERLRDVEPEDLLGREPVRLDETGVTETLAGKTVFITGAGGSIGSELCRQVARFGPRRLVLYELSEFNLYTIEPELGEDFARQELVRLIGDVKDLEHLRQTFAAWRPQVVFHASAFGESGQVLVLDMCEPVKIVDRARDLIRLAGHTSEEIAIAFTVLRPGEKLDEELLADADDT